MPAGHMQMPAVYGRLVTDFMVESLQKSTFGRSKLTTVDSDDYATNAKKNEDHPRYTA